MMAKILFRLKDHYFLRHNICVCSQYSKPFRDTCKLLPLSCVRLSSSGGTFTSCNTRGRRVTIPEPRGRKSRPTKLSNTELFPLLCRFIWRDQQKENTGTVFTCRYHTMMLSQSKDHAWSSDGLHCNALHIDSNSQLACFSRLTCDPTTTIWGSWMISAPTVRKTSCSLLMTGIRVSIYDKFINKNDALGVKH